MSAGFWREAVPLVLASGSATRRSLLESAGLPVEGMTPDVDERAAEAPLVAAGAPPAGVAGALARAKALAVGARHPGRWVLGCDQVLSLGARLFHKPEDPAAARRQLADLAGRRHHLDSAAVLVRDGTVLLDLVDRASLSMRPLSEAFLDAYLAAAGPAVSRSVGGYQLEGLGVHLFERVEGDHATVLGLPLIPLLSGFRRLGLVLG